MEYTWRNKDLGDVIKQGLFSSLCGKLVDGENLLSKLFWKPVKNGKQNGRQRYQCRSCGNPFNHHIVIRPADKA
ncbi:transposase-like zinc-binding domain-containing protein [Flagellimonas onchidii]|uniref:IS1/IS1595 family N-terminal zinc-binding domain-containing protein n=1 Tax=Flagellimonas onchidii TaxID=2562684 RepID=UPI0010A68D9E|nr:hypothetical protein [Allomuricauda onchidii]